MNSYKIYWQLKGFEDEYGPEHFSSQWLSLEFVLTFIGKLMEDRRVHSLGIIKQKC